MRLRDFLTMIWPSDGPYALATPFTIPGTDRRVYAHKVVDTVSEAVTFAKQVREQKDVFFAVHGLREPRVWNPRKVDARTGEPGAYEVRTRGNMRGTRALFFDIDVGGDGKYADRATALSSLREFCRALELPRPTVVGSGGGLHVYWPLVDEMDSSSWTHLAKKLKSAAEGFGLLVDPARTTDVSSVLRVPLTYNFKEGRRREVKILLAGAPTPNADMERLLHDAVVRMGDLKLLDEPSPQHPLSDLGSNVQNAQSGPPVSIKALAKGCRQMRRLIRKQGDVSEPEWYHSMNLVRFCDKGDKLIHKISEAHPDYDPDATESKAQQLRDKGVGPTTCAKLAEVCGEEHCNGCPLQGRVRTPLSAARNHDTAPAPVAAPKGVQPQQVTIPDAPEPFKRMKDGRICMSSTSADGDPLELTIHTHDLYPVQRVVNHSEGTEQQMWVANLPRQGLHEFALDADALYDSRKLAAALANQGVYVDPDNLLHMRRYMVAYIRTLQEAVDAETQSSHLGWTRDMGSFILPDRVIRESGEVHTASLSPKAARASEGVRRAGTLERQVELLSFYNHEPYRPNQFYILCGLAAPLFYATGHHGIVVNASGDPGASKSTSLYAAASLWGHPEDFALNGTSSGATTNARMERVNVLSNLPICVDEITLMSPPEAKELVMGITQSRAKIRLDRSGVERRTAENLKSSIMLTTANNSLHNLLAAHNSAGTAGSMRVFEMDFRAEHVHKKHEADTFMRELKGNYGHIGEVFMRHVIQNRAAIEQEIHETVERIDRRIETKSSERFWSAAIAVAEVAGRHAKKLGLLDFAISHVIDWVCEIQVPRMRGVVIEEYSTPMGILADYLESINANTIIVTNAQPGHQMQYVIREPRGEMLAHINSDEKVMWVLKRPFRDYCTRIGANSTDILQQLHATRHDEHGRISRVVSNPNIKKVLGAGTDHAKAQSWCFVINLDHPEVSGRANLEVVKGGADDAPSGKKIQSI